MGAVAREVGQSGNPVRVHPHFQLTETVAGPMLCAVKPVRAYRVLE